MIQCGSKESYNEVKTVAIRWDLARNTKADESSSSDEGDSSEDSEPQRKNGTKNSKKGNKREALSMAAVNEAIQRAFEKHGTTGSQQSGEALSLAAVESTIERAFERRDRNDRQKRNEESEKRGRKEDTNNGGKMSQAEYEEWTRKRPCWHCGQPGHNKTACPDKNIIDHPNAIICDSCGRKGHTGKYCYKKDRPNNNNTYRPNNVTTNKRPNTTGSNSIPLGKRRKTGDNPKDEGSTDKSE